MRACSFFAFLLREVIAFCHNTPHISNTPQGKIIMLTHVVMFKLHDTPDKTAIQHEIKTRLETLPALIDVIRHYEIGINVIPSARAYDMVLVSKFDNQDTLAVYSQHPDHVKHLDFIRGACANIVAVDYIG
jgi:hypothetical protein